MKSSIVLAGLVLFQMSAAVADVCSYFELSEDGSAQHIYTGNIDYPNGNNQFDYQRQIGKCFNIGVSLMFMHSKIEIDYVRSTGVVSSSEGRYKFIVERKK